MDSKELLERLSLAADIRVRQYTRHTKTGKSVSVRAHFRSPIEAMKDMLKEAKNGPGASEVSEQSLRVAVQRGAGRGPTRQEMQEARSAASKMGVKITNAPHTPAQPEKPPLTPAKDRKFGEASHDATDLVHRKDGEDTTAKAFDPAKSKVRELIRGKQKVPLGTRVGGGNPNPPADKGKGKGTPKDPIKVYGDLDLAVKLLAKGKSIRLETPREVSLLVDRVNDVVRDIQAKGEKAPDYDFCKISVPGTNLFCQESKGIPRAKMPQFKGVDAEGKKLDVEAEWQEMLDGAGIPTTRKQVPVVELKATQNQLVGAKVAGMAATLKAAKVDPEGINPKTGNTWSEDAAKIRAPIYVTSDGYVVDGHHRWAAVLVADAEDGLTGDEQMSVKEIGMEIGATIDLANEFTRAAGIVPKGTGADAEGVKAADAESFTLDDVDAADARLTQDPSVADDGYEGTVWRGVSVSLPPELAQRLTEALQAPEDESQIGRQFAVGQEILDFLQKGKGSADEAGLGAHWSDKYSFAKKAATAGDVSKPHKFIIQAQYPSSSKETDSRKVEKFVGEGEVTMKPNAKMRVTGLVAEGPDNEKINLLREPVEVGKTQRVQRVEAGLDNAATRNASRAYADFDRAPDGRVIIPQDILERDFIDATGPHSMLKYIDTTRDVNGKEVKVLSREREALHDELVRRLIDGVKPAKEGQRRVMFLGGGSGAGKGTATKLIAGYPRVRDLDKFGTEPAGDAVLIDPDALKLALPDWNDAPGDQAAAYTHEESSLLAKQATKVAQRLGLDVVQDGTGDGSAKKQGGKIRDAQGQGYRANAVYVTVPTEVAMVRNLVRAIEIRRKVPLGTVAEIHRSVSTVADAIKDQYDEFSLYDSNVPMGTPPPVIIERGIMRDQAKYDEFMAKTQQSYADALREAIKTAESRFDFKTTKQWDGQVLSPEEVRARVLFDLRNALLDAELQESLGLT